MAYPGAVLYVLSSEGINVRDYESTDHYQVMHSFMLHRHGVLDELFANEEV